ASVGVAIVGCGYWGQNLIRNFTSCPGSEVKLLCDQQSTTLGRVKAAAPWATLTTDFTEVLSNPAIDAIVIATPVAMHAPLAGAALRAGKHVLVEKPLAMSEREGEELVRLADRNDLILMVDHTFIYSEPVRKIKELVDAGELGDLYYLDSVRINLGIFQ